MSVDELIYDVFQRGTQPTGDPRGLSVEGSNF